MGKDNDSVDAQGGLKTAAVVVAALLLLIALAASLVFMGECAWPPLFWDANLQITPAINRASGRGDRFASYGTRILAREVGDYRFNYHGQLYQALLGALLPRGDFVLLMRAVGWLNAVSVVICAAYFFSFLRIELKQGVVGAAFWAIIGGLAVAAVLLRWQGRGEQIVPAILCLSGWLRLRIPRASGWDALTQGVAAGVLAATSPLPALLLLSGYLFWEAAATAEEGWLKRFVVIGFAAAGTWAAVIWLICPYSPWAIFKNSLFAETGGRPRGLRLIPSYWFWSEHFPLIGGIYLLFVLGCIPSLAALARRPRLQAAAALVCLLVLLRCAWTGGLAYPPFFYTLTCFLPLVLLTAVAVSYRWSARWGRGMLVPVAFFTIAVSLGYFHKLAVLPDYRAHGMSLQDARALAQRYISELDASSRIAFDAGRLPALIVLSDADWSLFGIDFAEDEVNRLERKLGIRFTYFFLSQDKEETPPPIKGPFVLRDNYFVSGRPKLWGFELAPAIPGYQFAVYERPAGSLPSQ